MNPACRSVVGGTFGVLATATVAASAAFACHPASSVELSYAQGPPGMTIWVEANGFDPGRAVEVRWDVEAGSLLGSQVAGEASQATGRAQVRMAVEIPSAAAVRAEPYNIVAVQPGADGTRSRAVKRFTVTDPPAAPVPPPEPTIRSDATRVPAAPVDRTAPVLPGTRASAAPVNAAPAVAVPSSAPLADRTAGSDPASPTPSGAAAGAPSAGLAAAPSAPGLTGVAPVAGATALPTAPAADALWSAVDSSRSPGLLDAPITTSQGGAPAGAALLAAGVVALAGVALVAARRRLAVATRS